MRFEIDELFEPFMDFPPSTPTTLRILGEGGSNSTPCPALTGMTGYYASKEGRTLEPLQGGLDRASGLSEEST